MCDMALKTISPTRAIFTARVPGILDHVALSQLFSRRVEIGPAKGNQEQDSTMSLTDSPTFHSTDIAPSQPYLPHHSTCLGYHIAPA